MHDDGEFSIIDDLTFEYEGNQVIKVTDAEPDGPYYKDAWHYRDGADAEIEREYDGNGNMVKDLDAGILRIEYNSLNLPQMIKFSDHSRHVYAYDATGKKLRAEYHTPIMVVAEPQVPDMGEEMPEQEEVLMEELQEWNEEEWGEEWEMEEEELIPSEMPDENGEVVEEPMTPKENNCKPTIFFEDDDIACEVTTVDYCGDFIYVNGKLKRMLFSGGYVTFRNDSIECPEYHFYITDHQGNVRIVANQDGTIEQINHYYPYGGLMGESTNSDHQPYKYNGKELDRHHGLDWYDYGARWYNGYSWTIPDPLAADDPSISPYVYCRNDPINAVDPDGEKIVFVNGKIGGGSPPAGSSYWNGEKSSFVQGAISYWKDRNIFFTKQDYSYFSSAQDRINAGYKYAQNNLDLLVAGLQNGESFKFVTHSMGAAFAEGIANYLLEQGYKVEEIVHINPFQAADISTNLSPQLKTTDYQNTDDWVINKIPFFSSPGKIENADYYIRENSNDSNLRTRHRSPIDSQGKSFWRKIDEKKIKSSFIDSPIKLFRKKDINECPHTNTT